MYFAKQNQFPDIDPVALESKSLALAALLATVKETAGAVQSKEAEARDLQVWEKGEGEGRREGRRGGRRERRRGGEVGRKEGRKGGREER